MAATSTATASQQPLKPTTETKPKRLPAEESFIIRPARLSDLRTLAILHEGATSDTFVTNFLTPRAHTYPEDQIRIHLQSIQKRYVNPASISLVACCKANPDILVGYSQSVRVGSEQGVRAVVHEKGVTGRVWLWVLGWVFWCWHALSNWVWKDRVSDFQRVKLFGGYVAADRLKYWSNPAWQDRWILTCMLVGKEWQRKGIASLLLKDVCERSEREGVVIGVSSSPHGEYLYRKVGFELMGDFGVRLEGEEDLRGGIMIRYPERWEGKRHEKYVGYFDLHKGE